MAVAFTEVGRRTTMGDRRVIIGDLVFSGNYATGGEAVTPALFGLGLRIDQMLFSGAAVATALTTAVLLSFNPLTNKILSYEAAASAAPFIEKDNAEAYITGQTVRVMVVGV